MVRPLVRKRQTFERSVQHMAEQEAPYGRVTQKKPAVAEIHILWITAGLGL